MNIVIVVEIFAFFSLKMTLSYLFIYHCHFKCLNRTFEILLNGIAETRGIWSLLSFYGIFCK